MKLKPRALGLGKLAVNIDIFKRMLERHPEGVSHSETHDYWPGGGRTRPKMDEVRLIVDLLGKEGTIVVSEIPRPRGRPRVVYQLTKYAAGGVKIPGPSKRHSQSFSDSIRDYLIGHGRTLRQLSG